MTEAEAQELGEAYLRGEPMSFNPFRPEAKAAYDAGAKAERARIVAIAERLAEERKDDSYDSEANGYAALQALLDEVSK